MEQERHIHLHIAQKMLSVYKCPLVALKTGTNPCTYLNSCEYYTKLKNRIVSVQAAASDSETKICQSLLNSILH